MRRLRTLLLPALAATVLLAPYAEAATSLNGTTRTRHVYGGTLSQPVALGAPGQPGDPQQRLLTPKPGDCVQSSCHMTEVELRLPKGRQSGELTYTVAAQSSLAETPGGLVDPVAYGVYDADGTEMKYWSPCCTPPSTTPRPGSSVSPSTAAKPISIARLAPGRYTFVVFNLGGPTTFSANLLWQANPSHRPTS